jgi:hypothetical protein
MILTMRIGTVRPTVWFLVLLALGFTVYCRGLRIPYYGDDYQYVYDFSSPISLQAVFSHRLAANEFYRPLEFFSLLLIQNQFTLNTFPVHFIALIMHVLLALLVYVFMVDLKFTKIQACLASLFMLFSQANVNAIASNDTLSQIGSALFGFFSLWLVYRYCAVQSMSMYNKFRARSYYILSVVFVALACLSKEMGVGFFPIIVITIIIMRSRQKSQRLFLRVFFCCVPFVVLAIGYLLLRESVTNLEPVFGPGRYNLGPGINIFRNIIVLLFMSFLPVSSVFVYTVFTNGSMVERGAILLLTAALVLLFLQGIRSSPRQYRIFLVWCIFFVLIVSPIVIFNHVSELHTYNGMPIVAAFFGLGVGALFMTSKKNVFTKAALMCFTFLFFTSNILAINSKLQMMVKSAERCNELISNIKPFLKKVPYGGTLVLNNPPGTITEYSIFVMHGFNSLKGGAMRLNQLAKRFDFKTEITSEPIIKQKSYCERCLVLGLRGETTEVQEIFFNPK